MFRKILTLGQIKRLKSDVLLDWLDSLPNSGELDLFPLEATAPITQTEFRTYSDRIYKLRIKKDKTSLVNKKNRVIHALGEAYDAVVWKDVPHMRKMLLRLKEIGADNEAGNKEYGSLLKKLRSEGPMDEKDEERKAPKKKSAQKKEKSESRQIETPFKIGSHKLFKKKTLRKWIQKLAEEEEDGQRIETKNISKTFLAHVNWRLHEWIESVVNFLPIASIVNTSRTAIKASCESASLKENEIKQALKLAQHKETKEEIGFKPNNQTLRDTILFFARPITSIQPDALILFQHALQQHTQALLKRYLKQNTGRAKLRVCSKKTLPGQVPKNPAAHVFSANADTFDFVEFDDQEHEENEANYDSDEQQDSEDSEDFEDSEDIDDNF